MHHAHAINRGIGRVYGGAARFDTGRPLTEDELHKLAPSIFATEAHESRSARFAPVPTIDLLRGLRKEGFEPVGARQGTCRIPGKSDFTKHLIRLRRFDNQEAHKVGDTVFEMLLKNANDGTAGYNLMAGLFRICCLNSVVTQTDEIDDVKIMHMGKNVMRDVIEGTYRVVESAQLALKAPAEWSQIKLEREEAKALADSAHHLRFADPHGEVKTVVQPDQFLQPRRAEDRGQDLWTIFNVIQEHAIRGGDRGVGKNANGQRLRQTSRPVTSIDTDIKLNRSLWVLGERMAQIKSGKPVTAAA